MEKTREEQLKEFEANLIKQLEQSKQSPNPIQDCPKIKPLVGITRFSPLEFDTETGKKRNFRVLIYSAHETTGPEPDPTSNGIAILDADAGRVVLDEHAKAQSGKLGPTTDQLIEFSRIKNMTWAGFRLFVNRHDRTRKSWEDK